MAKILDINNLLTGCISNIGFSVGSATLDVAVELLSFMSKYRGHANKPPKKWMSQDYSGELSICRRLWKSLWIKNTKIVCI